MSGSEPTKPLEHRAISDLWRNTLSQIHSRFGRLAYLAALRDRNTGAYEHHGLAFVFGEDQANVALFDSHLQTFLEWLNLSLEEQKADLDVYLAGLQDERAKVVANWLRLKPYESFVPATAKPAEKQLYMADMDALLEVLRREYGVASPDPDS